MTNVPIRYYHTVLYSGWFVCVCVHNSACDTETVTFIGSHLDVVPANPETWERHPFKLQVEVATLSSVNLSLFLLLLTYLKKVNLHTSTVKECN